RDGRRALVSTPPVLRVPQLAVHLDRSVNKDGLQLDPQRHMQPILGIGDIDVRVLLAAHAEPLDASGHLLAEDAPADPIDPDDIVGLDVLTVDAQAPALFGAHEEFLASARLDNLSSVHAEVQALPPSRRWSPTTTRRWARRPARAPPGRSSRTSWCGCTPPSAGTSPRAAAPSPRPSCSRPMPAMPHIRTIPSATTR